jgi:ATP-binding cassette, subfamily F, member 3
LKIIDIDKRFGDKVVLSEVNFHFSENRRYGVVGVNGAGKSSLLNILSSLDQPDGGSIEVNKDKILGFLPQEASPNPKETILDECLSGDHETYKLKKNIEKIEKELSDTSAPELLDNYNKYETAFRNKGGYSKEAEARKILAGLGFVEQQLYSSPHTLSGGWRMRLELAKLFLLGPDIFILDEPTNHLDLHSMIFVEDFLTNSNATTIFVSHDKGLLDRLATDILHLNFGNLNHYVGNYQSFLKQSESAIQLAEKAKAGLMGKIKELERFVERFGSKATKAKQAQSKQKQIDKLKIQYASIEIPEISKSINIPLPKITKSFRDVLTVNNLSIGYSEPLAHKVNFLIERGDKIAIVGPNGKGKSTLLKTIMKEISPLAGTFSPGEKASIAYFAQNQAEKLDTDKTVLENYLYSVGTTEQHARKILARFLFQGNDIHKQTEVLSGGEKNRLGLAIIFSSDNNFLVLDEPTNHLDMDSIDSLKSILDEYEGTVLFVSHNKDFTDHVAKKCLILRRNKTMELHHGNISSNEKLIKNDLTSQEDEDIQPQKKSAADQGADGKLTQKDRNLEYSEEQIRQMQKDKKSLTKSIASNEKLLSQLNKDIASLEEQLASISFTDYEKISNTNTELTEKRQAIDSTEYEMLEHMEKLDHTIDILSGLGRS